MALADNAVPSLGDTFIHHLKVKEFAGFKGRVLYRYNLECLEAVMVHLFQGDVLNTLNKLPAPLQWMRAKDIQAKERNK